MPTIPVQLPDHRYDVLVEPGLLNSTGGIVARFAKPGRAMVVTDEHVGPSHGRSVVQSLKSAGFDPVVATLKPGENNKTLAELLPVFDQFLLARVERSTPLVAVGGGIVGDMAGFVAASILRGVPFIQVPTTLLAMVDSSVGGKTGVNHAAGKNLIGAFYHPRVVVADPLVLATLPAEIFAGGLAECIKHEVIADAEGFTELERVIDDIVAGDVDGRMRLVAHNVAIKARVVEADPLERSVRAHLNFGHTFGHAIERASEYFVPHGSAVAVGMAAACRLAVDLGHFTADAADRVVRLIERAGLPTTVNGVDPDRIIDAMAFDKKVRASRVRFILPERIGSVTIVDGVPPAAVAAAVRSVCGAGVLGALR